MEKGIEIGIKDFNGNPIKNGDLVTVEFVNYMNTDKEYIIDNFDGEIVYNPFNCMFMIDRLDKESDSWNECFIINHRSMRIKIYN